MHSLMGEVSAPHPTSPLTMPWLFVHYCFFSSCIAGGPFDVPWGFLVVFCCFYSSGMAGGEMRLKFSCVVSSAL